MANATASYGVTNEACLGRAHVEQSSAITSPDHSAIGPFELDLRRVQSCAAFRRLQYKTQVFIAPRDDHFRTRLTHTLEVSGLARLLAAALAVNQTLAEVIALAHDLGHPPFGHAGEAALNQLMRDHGGFEHNAQSLRIIDYLEHPFPQYRGLNLTYEVREALARHRTAYDQPAAIDTDDPVLLELLQRGSQPTIAGQIVGLADRLAYDCHDLEDGLSAEVLSAADLAGLRLWEEAATSVRAEFPDRSLYAILRPILESLQSRLLSDAIRSTLQHIADRGVSSVQDVRRLPEQIVCFSPEVEAQVLELEHLLRHGVYRNPVVARKDEMAGRMMTQLFAVYREQPQRLPRRFLERVGQQPIERVVCDYIAGMTDRFCEHEFRSIFMPVSNS